MTEGAYRLLLVEDSPTARQMIRDALDRMEGVDLVVDEVGTLEEALDTAQDRAFDLIFMDYELPDGDGIQAIDNLRGLGVEDPIVMLTGKGDEDIASQAIRRGADDYLSKDGLEPVRIVQTVRNQIRLSELDRRSEFLARHRDRDGEPPAERLALLGAFGASIQEGLSVGMTDLVFVHETLDERLRDLERSSAADQAGKELERVRLLVDDLGETLDRLDRLDSTLHSLRRLTLAGVERETVDLDEVVAALARVCGTGSRVEVETDLDGPESIEVDLPAIRQVVSHLVNNAIQASPADGAVTLSTRSDGDDAVIEVADAGPGIPEEVEDRIFDLYVTTKEDHEGLGLPLVRALVQNHGGTVTHREREGDGTVFTVRIPRAGADDDT